MEESEKARLGQLVTNVMKYYRQDPTVFLLNVWWQACSGFDYVQVERAMHAHMADPERGQFAPKVSDVVRWLAGTASDRAVAAWGKVYDAMGRVGAYSDVVFDDPAVHAVINDMGGWPALCRTEVERLSYAQHRFMELYRTFSQRPVEGYPRVLGGERSPDEDYVRRGLPPPAPVLVGDQAACALVYQGGGEARVRITHLQPGVHVAAALAMPEGFSVKRLPLPGGSS